MSELSDKVARLKGRKTTKAIHTRAGLSRETFHRIERGENVKLSTLKDIWIALGGNNDDWTDLIVAWVKLELGDEAKKLVIQPAKPTTKDNTPPIQAQIFTLCEQLPHQQKVQILNLLQRPELIRAIPTLNSIYESLHK